MNTMMKTTIGAYILYKAFDLVIHGLILKEYYIDPVGPYRENMSEFFWIFFVGPIVTICIITKLHGMLKEHDGTKFALLMAVLLIFPGAAYTYASFAVGIQYTLLWSVLGFIQVFAVVKFIHWMQAR